MSSSFLRRPDDATPYDAQAVQINDEKEHRKSTADGHRDLLKAKLASLKGKLLQELRGDEWMHESNTTTNPLPPPVSSRRW